METSWRVWTSSKKPVYFWNEHAHLDIKGKAMRDKFNRNSDKLSDKEQALAEAQFDKASCYSFGVGLPKNFQLGSGSASSGSNPAGPGSSFMAIYDVGGFAKYSGLKDEDWKEAQDLLNQTKEGLSKLKAQLKRCLQTIGNNEADPVYDVVILVFY